VAVLKDGPARNDVSGPASAVACRQEANT
jgi:hypothetical protein